MTENREEVVPGFSKLVGPSPEVKRERERVVRLLKDLDSYLAYQAQLAREVRAKEAGRGNPSDLWLGKSRAFEEIKGKLFVLQADVEEPEVVRLPPNHLEAMRDAIAAGPPPGVLRRKG